MQRLSGMSDNWQNVLFMDTSCFENKRRQFWFCCHMSYFAAIFGVVDAGLHYDTNMAQPDNDQTTYDSKTKIVVFYSLSNAFDLIFGSKFIFP